jgi:hypothetical protein
LDISTLIKGVEIGTIPAILATSGIYVLWHVGTQLPLEADPVDAVWKLFLVGVMSQSVFSLTRNLLTIWPFFHAVGVMLDFAVNLEAVDQVVNDFSWAVGTVLLMFITGVVLARVIRWQSGRREGKIGLDATPST